MRTDQEMVVSVGREHDEESGQDLPYEQGECLRNA